MNRMAYTVKIISHGRTVKAREKENLAEKIQQAGIPLSLACNRRGLCGKCFVEIVKGKLPPLGVMEKSWLKQKKLPEKSRLACSYEIRGNLEVNIPLQSTAHKVPILPSISHSSLSLDPAVKTYSLELARPTIAEPSSLFDILLKGLGARHLKISPLLLRGLGQKVEKADFKVAVSLYREKEIIEVEPAPAAGKNLGLAVDVGTTTLVMELIDLETGQTLGTQAEWNSQARRGADVISRISYAISETGKAAELRELVMGTLNQMIAKLLKKNGAPSSSVREIVIAGNTTMNHLLLGVMVHSLASAPYSAVFSRIPSLDAGEAGFAIHPRGKVYVVPNIKSFVGGDISSGLLASRLNARRGNLLFIDLGTNGEIVLKAGGTLLATSTAAGPAFEGMNISCGMPALPGAVYKAEDSGGIRLFTLGDEPVRGVCGTGLIDLIAILIDQGLINSLGSMRTEEKKIAVGENISITQEDVRQMQLACAAIKTGIRMMLERNRLNESDLDGIYIAGAFGNYLSIRNSMKIGLLPRMDERKLVFIGNSSLAGARLLLLSQRHRERLESLIQKIHYVSLASDATFQEQFIRALEFKSWP